MEKKMGHEMETGVILGFTELNLRYHIGETVLVLIYIYIYAYPLW